MGIGFYQQDPRRLTGNQFQKRLQQGVENVVHAEILGESKSRLAEGIGFGRGRFREGQVSCHLFFGRFSRRNILRGSHQPAHESGCVPHREAVNRHPAHRAIGPDNPKFFVDLAGRRRLRETRQDANFVLGVKQLLIGRGIISKRIRGPSGDDLEGRVDGDDVLRAGVDHPENLLDVVRHLPETFVAFA